MIRILRLNEMIVLKDIKTRVKNLQGNISEHGLDAGLTALEKRRLNDARINLEIVLDHLKVLGLRPDIRIVIDNELSKRVEQQMKFDFNAVFPQMEK